MNDAEDVVNLRIRSDPEELPGVRTHVQAMASSLGFANAEVGQIMLAVDEALTNVIRHGYAGARNQPIELRLERTESGAAAGLSITIRDFGRQVDPASICGRPLEAVRPGGLGVHIIRSIMNEVSYECAEGGGMRLIMFKKKSP
jgi:anti-sigma regulatory factor (Ser/Thr protein kinase)